MKNIGWYLASGGIGALIGSALTLFFIKKRDKEIIQDKIDEAKIEKLKYERLVKKYGVLLEDETVSEKDVSTLEKGNEVIGTIGTIEDSENIIVPVKHMVDYSSIYAKEPETGVHNTPIDIYKTPYVIGPEESKASPPGDIWGYDYIEFTYYSDDILADDRDEKIEESKIADILGTDWKNRFGEVDENIVYVRNDRLKCDYEIVKDNRTYKEVVGE